MKWVYFFLTAFILIVISTQVQAQVVNDEVSFKSLRQNYAQAYYNLSVQDSSLSKKIISLQMQIKSLTETLDSYQKMHMDILSKQDVIAQFVDKLIGDNPKYASKLLDKLNSQVTPTSTETKKNLGADKDLLEESGMKKK